LQGRNVPIRASNGGGNAAACEETELMACRIEKLITLGDQRLVEKKNAPECLAFTAPQGEETGGEHCIERSGRKFPRLFQ